MRSGDGGCSSPRSPGSWCAAPRPGRRRAGGALQTGQRFGAAIGTATLPALFYLVLASTDNDFRAAVAAALTAAVAGVAAALVIAVIDRWREVDRDRREADDRHPAEQHP